MATRRSRRGQRFQEVLNVSTPRASTPVADCVSRRGERNRGRTDRSIARLRPPVVRSQSHRRIGEWIAPPTTRVARSARATYLRKRRDECRCERWPRTFRATLVPFPRPCRNVSRTELNCVRPRRLPILQPVCSRNFLENGSGQRRADVRAPISCRRWRKRYAHGVGLFRKLPSQFRRSGSFTIDIYSFFFFLKI